MKTAMASHFKFEGIEVGTTLGFKGLAIIVRSDSIQHS